MTSAFSPRSLPEAMGLLATHGGLRPIAGCTDVMVPGAHHQSGATGVMDLLRVPELRGVSLGQEEAEIGATTTFAELGAHAGVGSRLPMVTAVSSVVGGWQVQTRATVGGNIVNASPAGDSLPVWLALGATAVVQGPQGTRQIRYEDLHVGYRTTALAPDELLVRLRVPMPVPGTVHWFTKVGTRQALAISKVVLAAAFRLDGDSISEVRVAAGSVAAVPVRLREVEAHLLGRTPSERLAQQAGELARQHVHPIDDVRSTARYRAHVVETLIRRCVLELGQPHTRGPEWHVPTFS